MNIYFVRHGESIANTQNIIGGNIDSPLTENGIAQATETAEKLQTSDLGIEKIISSNLVRAAKTADIISDHLGLPVERWEDLSEVFYGKCQGEPWPGDEQYKTALQFVEKGLCAQAEDLETLRSRAQGIILQVQSLDVDNVLIVGHATFIAVIFSLIQEIDIEEMVQYRMDWTFKNASIKKTTFTLEDGFSVEENFSL